MVLPDSEGISPVPTYSGSCSSRFNYSYVAVTRYGRPSIFKFNSFYMQSYNPGVAVTTPVWALPISLATTLGITIVFFSYEYRDWETGFLVFN